MSDTARLKPLWWRVRLTNGNWSKWHEDPLTIVPGGRAYDPDRVRDALSARMWWCEARCTYRAEVMVGDDGVQTRRSAPPVADQCKRCRAEKAKQKGAAK